jgi:hypothetical protein
MLEDVDMIEGDSVYSSRVDLCRRMRDRPGLA